MSISTSPKRRRHTKVRSTLQATTGVTCQAAGGKVRYPRRKAALTAMNFVRTHVDGAGCLTGVYHCPHCGDWHMTSQEQRP